MTLHILLEFSETSGWLDHRSEVAAFATGPRSHTTQ